MGERLLPEKLHHDADEGYAGRNYPIYHIDMSMPATKQIEQLHRNNEIRCSVLVGLSLRG